jgi:bacteriocin-like protein
MTMFHTLTIEELACTTGGQQLAPSTGINLGVKAMELMDHPQKTLDSVKGFLGIQDSCAPNSVYTPAAMNSTGGITPASCSPPPSDGPSVPMSQ